MPSAINTALSESLDTIDEVLRKLKTPFISTEQREANARRLGALIESLQYQVAGVRLIHRAAEESVKAGREGRRIFEQFEDAKEPMKVLQDAEVLARAWGTAWSAEELQEALRNCKTQTMTGLLTTQRIVTYQDAIRANGRIIWENLNLAA